MDENLEKNIVTVREAVERLKRDGIPVSEYALRGWLRTGAFSCRRVGKKALIPYRALVEFVEQADSVAANDPVEAGGIRRLEVR